MDKRLGIQKWSLLEIISGKDNFWKKGETQNEESTVRFNVTVDSPFFESESQIVWKTEKPN